MNFPFGKVTPGLKYVDEYILSFIPDGQLAAISLSDPYFLSMIQDDNFWRRRVNLLHPRLVWKLPHNHRTWMSYCQHLFNCQLFSVTVDGKYLLHVPIEKTFSSLLRLSKYKFYQTFTTVWLLNLYGSLTETYEFTDYPSSSKHDGNTLGPRIFIRSRNEINERLESPILQ